MARKLALFKQTFKLITVSINLTQRRRNGIETKERLLQSTESLFASGGFAGLTMREVASRSRTNIASAHYHFGSKEAMVLEMLKTRIGPINAKRMKYLSEAKEAKAGKPLSTFEIFRSLILPIGEEISKSAHSRESLAQLVARSFTEPAGFIQKMHKRFFGELSQRFMDELRLAHPGASDEDLYWNLHFVISSMLGALAQHRRLNDFSEGTCREDEVGNMIERQIVFVSNGFEGGLLHIK
ncbi:MAG TPA: hypothetical protein DCX67_12965 [Opitutae bacterium]|nr:hypothetical protein [Opitutae bacterium]